MDTILGAHVRGPIVFYNDRAPSQPRSLVSYMQFKQMQVQKEGCAAADDEGEEEMQQEENKRWTLRKFLTNLFYNRKKGKKRSAPNAYNLYDRDPDFHNSHGWSIALDEGNYAPLGINDIGVYLVNLTAVSELFGF